MFDFAWSELMVIGAVALVVIGPKDLPKALKTAGIIVRRARGMAREFQNSVEDMIREAELEDVRKSVQDADALRSRQADPEHDRPRGPAEAAADLGAAAEAKPPPAEPPPLAEPFIAPRIPPAHE